MGDVIHALPAVTEAHRRCPTLQLDWVVEAAFVPLVTRHPQVRHVIPFHGRRWRHQVWRQPARVRQELGEFWRQLRRERYDWVLDTQGLLKSALIALMARGPRAGFSRNTAREWLAATVYRRAFPVAREQHAIQRQRQLFAGLLGDDAPADGVVDYGWHRDHFAGETHDLWLLHGTTWPSKQWPLAQWRRLATLATAAGWRVRIPAANDAEQTTAEAIAAGLSGVTVLPRGNLDELLTQLATARAVVGVDSGLLHAAAALNRPAVGLYGPTAPGLTASVSDRHTAISADFACAPCLRRRCPLGEPPPCWATVSADAVWATLNTRL